MMIVDCLLPGQIRTLGTQTTYLSARRPVRTSARDCETRGGEYVAYDRADYATALSVWMDAAQSGDPDAQTRVGEIYERGIGGRSDYEAAAFWYRRAAKTGYTRAQLNLGNLYEKGLGVEADPLEALHLYQLAAGRDAALNLDPTTVTAATNGEKTAELERELVRLNEEVARLNESLMEANAAIDEASRVQEDTSRASSALSEKHRAEQQRAEAERAEISAALQARDEQITALKQRTQTLHDALAAAEGTLASRTQELEARKIELARRAQSDAEDRDSLRKAQTDLQAAEDTLQQYEAQIAAQRAELADLRNRITSAERTSPETVEETRALLPAPTITLVDPQPTRIDDQNIVELREGIDRRVIIGQVQSAAGLVALTVNDATAETNDAGVFRVDIALSAETNPVAITAVDNHGKRTDLRLVLRRSLTAQKSPDVASSPLEEIDFGTYHALVIGNNDYEHLPDLQTAVNDAHKVAELLEQRFGFQTVVLTDANRYTILSALNNMRETLTSSDNLLIYYAGHGELDEANMRGHWLPVDAEAKSTANWISNVAITDLLNAMQAKQILVVVDSCYAGTLTRSSVAHLGSNMTEAERLNWFKTMAEKRSRMVLTSGGLEPVLDSGGGENSIFARAFTDVLANTNHIVTVQTLYEEVAARVALAAERLRFEQVPQYAPIRFAGHESGDFFLRPRPWETSQLPTESSR